MENSQKEIIVQNLDRLVEMTTCKVKLLAKMEALGVLSEDDTEELGQLGNNRMAQSYKFYKILLTREKGFETLLNALQETNQSGAVSILIAEATKKKINVFDDIGSINYNESMELGRGSNGTIVFRGKFADRNVAVKRVHVDMVTQMSIVSEIKSLKECDTHENIVRYFGTKVVPQHVLIVLELCDMSLKDWVSNKNIQISPIEILRQTTTGLEWLHSRRIVHRDLKPENILLNREIKKVKISDFGLSRKILEERSSVSSTATGTMGWVASEILKNMEDGEKLKFTFASDTFALGCLYYYVLTDGKHPFGDNLRRNVNILEGKPQLHTLNTSYVCAKNFMLMEFMISNDPMLRPLCCDLLSCPLFWESTRRASFLADVKAQGKEVMKSVLESFTALPLEKHCQFNHTMEINILKKVAPEIKSISCSVPFMYLEYQVMQECLEKYYPTATNFCGSSGVSISSKPFEIYIRRSEGAVVSMLKNIIITEGIETTKRVINDAEKFTDISNYTPFLYHIVSNMDSLPPDFLEITKLLVEKGADPDATFGKGDKFLHIATEKIRDPQIFHTLVEYLISVKKTTAFGTSDSMKKTVLHHAVKFFEPLDETLEMLGLHGYNDYNVVDKEQDNIFFSAIKGMRNESFLRKLIDRGADWTHSDDYKFTALHYAALYANLPAFKFLISLGADVKAQNIYRSTPLHEAVKLYGECPLKADEMVLSLVSLGADVNVKSDFGFLPLELVLKGCTDLENPVQVGQRTLELLKPTLEKQFTN